MEQIRSRAWLLHAEFHVAGHSQIADIRTRQIFPDYVRRIIDTRASYFNQRMKALVLLSLSTLMPTDMSSLCNREVVPVLGILYDSRLVFEDTVQAIFRGIDGLTARWGALHFGPGTDFPSLNEHPAYIRFLAERLVCMGYVSGVLGSAGYLGVCVGVRAWLLLLGGGGVV
jgi:hypothetical protein